MKDAEIWSIEEELWTGGPDHYRKIMDPHCVMAFPAPAGILSCDAIMKSLDDMPRWSSVEMSDQHAQRPAHELIVLAYKAEGEREGYKAYRVFCTSTYCLAGDGWRLIQHQQSPA